MDDPRLIIVGSMNSNSCYPLDIVPRDRVGDAILYYKGLYPSDGNWGLYHDYPTTWVDDAYVTILEENPLAKKQC